MTAVISLATIPDRIAHIAPCVRALAAQGLPVYVWAVEQITRSATRLAGIPEELRAIAGVTVTVVEDRGPATKLLPALEAGFDTIITADDDVIYGAGWAAGLLAWSARLPDAALAYRGRVLGADQSYASSRVIWRPVKPVAVDILTGSRGALYHARLFGAGFTEEWRLWPANDDLVACAHLRRHGVPRYVVPGSWSFRRTQLHAITPLCAGNVKAGANEKGLRKLW